MANIFLGNVRGGETLHNYKRRSAIGFNSKDQTMLFYFLFYRHRIRCEYFYSSRVTTNDTYGALCELSSTEKR